MSAPASPLPPPGPFDPALVSADGKNAKTIECNLCKCKILRAGKGVYLKETVRFLSFLTMSMSVSCWKRPEEPRSSGDWEEEETKRRDSSAGGRRGRELQINS